MVDPPSHGGQHGAGPVAPGCIYFGFCPSSLVLTRAASASEMHWASMAMHYTASMPSMQAESDGKVKYSNNKKEYKCPCPEKVCNYPVFARVKCMVCALAIRMARMQNRSCPNVACPNLFQTTNSGPKNFFFCKPPMEVAISYTPQTTPFPTIITTQFHASSPHQNTLFCSFLVLTHPPPLGAAALLLCSGSLRY